jgi:putative ABC transport system permease protein
MSVAWRKVLSDLRSNKARTLLTTVTIAVGVFAVGFVSSMKVIMEHDLDADYQSVNPHSAIIYCEPFDDELLPAVERVPGVGQVEGRSQLTAHVVVGSDRKIPVQIIAVPPPQEMRVDRLRPNVPGGSITLADRELLLERSGLVAFPFREGGTLEVELPGGVTREMRVAGFVHDPTIFPYMFMGYITAYTTPETMVWLGRSRDYNQMLVTVSERHRDKAHVAAVAQVAAERIEQSGREVFETFMYKPGRHFAADIGQAMMAILFVLGLLTVLLGAFLVVNTVMALLAQHTRQIGIMKAVGGDTLQIARMYIGLVLVFGVLSLLLAVPLSACAIYGVSRQMMLIINAEPGPFRIPLQSVLWQIGVALVSPVAAALAPVLNSARVTVREALNDYGIGKARFGENGLGRLMAWARFLSRPLLLSLRNAFRRWLRLALTLSTLTLGGAIFTSVFNLWSALDVAVVQLEGYLLADVNVSLDQVAHFQRLEPLVVSVPGVTAVEGWDTARAQVLSSDGSPAVEITILAPPSHSTLIRPVLTAGRWLVPGD